MVKPFHHYRETICGLKQAYSGTNTSIPSNWIGKMAIDQIGLNSITATGVESYNKDNLPTKYELRQNYPNPFNPSTAISYSILKSGLVTLRIYDILGKEVATLFNGQKTPGNYAVNFNASNLSSGIYFYILESGSFISTKKMVMLK